MPCSQRSRKACRARAWFSSAAAQSRSPSGCRQRLRESFRRAGVDFERRVTFLPWQPAGAFRALLRRADLYLDTLGFSGFNTALQALECGLPVDRVRRPLSARAARERHPAARGSR